MICTWGVPGLFAADPEKCYREIQTLKAVTPENIVDYARDEGTELHKCFQWDDAKAAENWRKQQARTIICNLKVVVETKREDKEIRFYYHDNTAKEYIHTIHIVRNEDEYKRLLVQAKRELQAFKERYKTIAELSKLIEEIETVLKE